jgi:hypothetical protein
VDPNVSLRIRMVSHKDLFKFAKVDQPTYTLYNSMAIQIMLHSIPTLSSPFMMLDDDFLFGKTVPTEHIFDKEEQKYILRLANAVTRNEHHMYLTSFWNTFDMFAKKYPNDTQVARIHTEKTLHLQEHGPILLFREDGYQMWKDFRTELLAELGYPFRNQKSISAQFMYRLVGGSRDRYSTLPTFGLMLLTLKDKNYGSEMRRLLKEEERPYFICLNDDFSSSDEAFLAKATAYIQSILDNIFPEKVIA